MRPAVEFLAKLALVALITNDPAPRLPDVASLFSEASARRDVDRSV
jgi:hypothetical protein